MSVDERSSPWWRCRPLILAALLAALIPLLWPGLPPLTDLPGHVARWHIAMAPAASPLRGYYHIRWALIGNLGADLLALLLTPLIGLLPAAKLIVIATSLAAMAGLLWLAREAHGRIPPTIFFALPFLFGWPFQMGFVNFALAQAMAFAGCALGLRLARTGTILGTLMGFGVAQTLSMRFRGIPLFDAPTWVTVPGGAVTGNNLVWKKVTFAGMVSVNVALGYDTLPVLVIRSP